jgi:hypothetical protein
MSDGLSDAAGRRPRLLLFTTERWPTAALLAQALADAGFEVAALCPPGHPLRAVKGLIAAPAYRHLRRHAQLADLIAALGPVGIVPCDDGAVAILHDHHARCKSGLVARPGAELIEQSLGDPAHYALLEHKSAFVRLAAEHGLQTPQTVVIESRAGLVARLATTGFPVVVKADGWSGGRGTRIAQTVDEALAAFDSLSRPLSWTSALRDALYDGAMTPLYHRAEHAPAVVTLQAFAPGVPVNRAVICRGGKVVAGRTFEAVQTMPNNGNATVVRPCRIPQVEVAVERCVALLGLSGVAGFDFIYDEGADAAYLLEVNPRATSACYTAPAGEANLAAAFFAAMAGGSAPDLTVGEEKEPLIALFPQEFERDPASQYLLDAEQQTPVDRPDLVEACRSQAASRSPYARLLDAVRAMRARRAGRTS